MHPILGVTPKIPEHKLCSLWASMDMCTQTPSYMLRGTFCKLTCQQCGELISDHKTGQNILLVEQSIAGNKTEKSETLQVLAKIAEYLISVVLGKDIFEGIYIKCMNNHKLC